MIGAGPVAFALWPYIITNARPDEGSLIDLNPDLIAAIFGCSPNQIQEAIDFFCQPDARSRTATSDGCRLIKKSPLTYFVVNLEHYRFLDDSDDRREYWRSAKANQRSKRQGKRKCPGHVPDFPGHSTMSPNADADADTSTSTNADTKKHSKTKNGVSVFMEVPPSLDVPQFISVWTEWHKFREEIKKKITPRSAKAQLEQLERWGVTGAIKALKLSIANGWQGIFEPKKEEPTQFRL